MTPRERLDAIEARAAATVEFPGEATVQVRVVNTYEVVARDVPALVAFARAVIEAADAALEPGRVGEIRRFSLCRTVDRLAHEHLRGES